MKKTNGRILNLKWKSGNNIDLRRKTEDGVVNGMASLTKPLALPEKNIQ
jgi:hypothetical protein